MCDQAALCGLKAQLEMFFSLNEFGSFYGTAKAIKFYA